MGQSSGAGSAPATETEKCDAELQRIVWIPALIDTLPACETARAPRPGQPPELKVATASTGISVTRGTGITLGYTLYAGRPITHVDTVVVQIGPNPTTTQALRPAPWNYALTNPSTWVHLDPTGGDLGTAFQDQPVKITISLFSESPPSSNSSQQRLEASYVVQI